MNQVRKQRDRILNGPILKTIISLALPLIVGNLVQNLYNITDAYWVGKLGSIEFAAISYIWPINFALLAFAVGFSGAATSLIGQCMGSEKIHEGKQFATQFFMVAVIFGVFFSVTSFMLAPNILKLMGAEGLMYRHSLDYLRIVLMEIPILFVYYVYKSMREGVGDTKSPTVLIMFSVALNMILDPLFVISLGLGVKGAGYATVLSKVAVVGYMIYRMLDRREMIYIDLKDFKWDIKILSNLTTIGLPASLGQTVSALGFAVMNTFIIDYGSDTVAAFGLGNRITSFAMMPAFGLGGALAAFIGQNIGAQNYLRAKRAVFKTMGLGFIVLTLGGLCLSLFRLSLIQLFVHEPEVIKLSNDYMIILTFVFPSMAIFQSLIGTFQGSGHTKYVLVMTLSRLWILRVPMIIIAKNCTNLGSSGIWYAMLLSNVIVCCIGIVILARGRWLKPTLA